MTGRTSVLEPKILEPEKDVEERTRLAPQWKVILHNDDVTTFEFVIDLLRTLFKKDAAEAVRLTFEVHSSGSAMVTVTTFEHAELYCDQVKSLSRPRGFPLVATMEPA
jgi:ATP-dependent Clp protease adaptor protein ClpS